MASVPCSLDHKARRWFGALDGKKRFPDPVEIEPARSSSIVFIFSYPIFLISCDQGNTDNVSVVLNCVISFIYLLHVCILFFCFFDQNRKIEFYLVRKRYLIKFRNSFSILVKFSSKVEDLDRSFACCLREAISKANGESSFSTSDRRTRDPSVIKREEEEWKGGMRFVPTISKWCVSGSEYLISDIYRSMFRAMHPRRLQILRMLLRKDRLEHVECFFA